MDKIVISDLVVHAIIGVHAHEQLSEQPLLINLSFSVDIERAAKQDSLSDTHDYAKICESIIVFVKKTPCRLLETLAKLLAAFLKKQFQLSGLTLSIRKKPSDILEVGSVSVVVHL